MSTPPNVAILEANLAALAIRSPLTANLVRLTPAREDIEWLETPEGPSARMGFPPTLLCSARRPADEARALVGSLDLEKCGGVAVLGMGVGHHVRELATRLGRHGAIFVFEPDVGLLRAVLERVDLAAVLAATHTVVLTDPDDEAALAGAVRGVEGLLSLGVKLLEPPAHRPRLGDAGRVFGERLTTVMRAVRTNVVTTLMHAEVTLRNGLMNLGRYASAPGIEDLRGAARGRPAIVVSAGPSLRRNIELLSRPGVRERFVIIAVQTVLKTLLERGIRPHFVTALDFHEISRRFYEGLTPADVEGVTLVAEPKASAAILDAFPGAIRCPADERLDRLLGPGLGGAMGEIKPGSTVAHLAYYLARHLGCDPVVLVGQDLGFTDGQYYAAGAAIHAVWGAELSPFTSIESLEWQRIVRGRPTLHRAVDAAGRPVYTDEQMNTYRLQFEAEFARDEAAGLSVIDATEGGVAKRHTRAMTLAEAIGSHRPATDWRPPPAPERRAGAPAPADVRARVREVRASIERIRGHCSRTAELLGEMRRRQKDQARVNRMIADVERIRDEVRREEPAFWLTQWLNQTGTLRRVRADRSIALAAEMDPIERQRRQIERDVQNVEWLRDAAGQLGTLLDAAATALDGGPKLLAEPAAEAADEPEDVSVPAARRRVGAVVLVDERRGGLGTARDLSQPWLGGMNPLELLLRRLARCAEIDRVVVLAEDPERARALGGEALRALGARAVVERPVMGPWGRRAVVGAARLAARSCWRGGVSNLSVYDEALAPEATLAAMERLGLESVVPLGADWALVDPALVDAVVARHRTLMGRATPVRFAFAHAAPGLGACVLESSLLRDLAVRAREAGVFATMGGLLGYVPLAPVPDPIAKPPCVTPDPVVRDAGVRFVPDSPAQAALLARALRPIEGSIVEATAEQIASLAADRLWSPAAVAAAGPTEITLEVCTGRLTSGVRGQWLRAGHDSAERPCLTPAAAGRLFERLAALRPDAAVTLAGAGDPLLHPELPRFVEMARRAGFPMVHVRTDLLAEPAAVEALLDAEPDVISVDLMAETPETYRRMMGMDGLERARGNLQRVLARRAERAGPAVGVGLALPLVVPRITRCDATYEEIESFYDRWTLVAGAAAIDPLPPSAVDASSRIAPLPVPASASRRLAAERLVVLCDGRVPASEHELSGERSLGDVLREDPAVVWRRWATRRLTAPAPIAEPKPAPAAVA